MAQSSYGDRWLKKRVASYLDAFTSFFDFLRPLPLYHLVPPVRFGITCLDMFTLEINVGEGVSCLGQQAPMYLLINYIIISVCCPRNFVPR
jgi:hypothetical protein